MYAGSQHAVNQRERYVQFKLGENPPNTPYHRLVYAYKDRPSGWNNLYSIVYDTRNANDLKSKELLLEMVKQIEDYTISDHEYALELNDYDELMKWANNRK